VERGVGAQAHASLVQRLEPPCQQAGHVAAPPRGWRSRGTGKTPQRLDHPSYVGGERPHRGHALQTTVLEGAEDLVAVPEYELPVVIVHRVTEGERADAHGRLDL